MDTWQGNWEFGNSHTSEDGRTGTTTVPASSEGAARDAIKERVSKDLFGHISWQAYVEVKNLINVTQQQY